MKQIKLIRDEPKAYGGELLKTRKGRRCGRPIDIGRSMHLVLRSSKAKGEWSFRRVQNSQKISTIIDRFSKKYGVRIISLANVGNHLHFHLQLTSRHTYKAFIRATTSAIAMAVTGTSRWHRSQVGRLKFWDYRPFTRVIVGFRALLNLRDYIRINKLEGKGYSRKQARYIIKRTLCLKPDKGKRVKGYMAVLTRRMPT